MRLPFLTAADTPNRKIFRAAGVVGAITLIVKLGATLKELVVASKFGRGEALDAFLIAYLAPAFLVVLLGGAFEAAVIPVFIGIRQKRGLEEAENLLSSLMLVNVMAMAALAGAIALSAPYLLRVLASGFTPEKLRLTEHLLYAALPLLIFSGFSCCAVAALNAMERFALPAFSPLITSIAIIAFIGFGPTSSSWGGLLLVAGTVAGSMLEAIVLARALLTQGVRLRMRWTGFTPEVRGILSQYFPMLGGIFLMSGTAVVDQSMATMLAPGSVAALGYANKIVSAAVGIGATAISTAAFPYLSKMVAAADWQGCRHTLKRYLTLIAIVTVPLMAGLMVFSKPLVAVLFQRGAFTSADTELVSRVQICYSLQIPFFVGASLLAKFLSSARRNHILLYVAGANLTLDVILNLALMRVMGVAGIALSTSLVYMMGFTCLAALAIRMLAQKRGEGLRSKGAPSVSSLPTGP